MKARRMAVAILSSAAAMAASIAVGAWQQATPAELATRLSGTWAVNMEKSGPALNQGRQAAPANAPRGGGGGRAGYAIAGLPFGQRGGGGGGGNAPASDADMTPAERAAAQAEAQAQAAVRTFQQVPPQMTIQATAQTVTIADQRGERMFTANDRNTKIDVNGTAINAKTRWERTGLRQEFSHNQTKIIYLFDPSLDGKELTFTLRFESAQRQGELKIFYDKK